ncbi:Gamma-interferon-inducible lysosomal thiol reductase [Orchesella cincta]|uniref:Gamma-interferon-inducible lysosomal thiol reductase n=1 Tax=Orchesella cincta TaxID=48709 RepID=A0A1D2N3H1_ORCCI|nr:Gamma-interferon-inducible lysosomal thiol reductase [Orchesella cincta]
MTHFESHGVIFRLRFALTILGLVGVLLVQESSAFMGRRAHFRETISPRKEANNSVTINLYYESLCPDCVDFISRKLCPLWEDMSNYLRIDFVPYGNAETIVSKTGEISFECQHGPPECEANFIHDCALKHLSYKESIKFICCMESRHSAHGTAEICAEELEVDYAPIKTCAAGPEGIKLHYAYGQRTDKLVPSHEWVPWILFNGQYNKEDMDHAQDDLLSVLCKYIEDPKPTVCNEVY